jgi:hypothetical protein
MPFEFHNAVMSIVALGVVTLVLACVMAALTVLL